MQEVVKSLFYFALLVSKYYFLNIYTYFWNGYCLFGPVLTDAVLLVTHK